MSFHHLPYPRNPFFIERDDVSLEDLFEPSQQTSLQRGTLQTLVGLCGSAKTQLAIEYVQGIILAERKFMILGPQQAQAFTFSPVHQINYFEVTGPVRVISIKEYVHLYDESWRQRNLEPFQWKSSVYQCIRDFDAYERHFVSSIKG